RSTINPNTTILARFTASNLDASGRDEAPRSRTRAAVTQFGTQARRSARQNEKRPTGTRRAVRRSLIVNDD
ncbi:MAG: hypothetical protein EBY44_00415, partial [Actinobacteria bacterium]|nr:hypothetical protein [Actinomycetota bacterium]